MWFLRIPIYSTRTGFEYSIPDRFEPSQEHDSALRIPPLGGSAFDPDLSSHPLFVR